MEGEVKNYIVDFLMFIAAVPLFITGIIKLRFVMGLLSLEWNSPLVQVLSRIHDWTGVVLVALVLVHLVLHREWIGIMTKHFFHKEEGIKSKTD